MCAAWRYTGPKARLVNANADAFHLNGVPTIPGLVQCALYDLGGLESLTLACGGVELSASVASHGNHGRLLHLRPGNKDVQPFGTNSPYWIEIGTFDATGQPVHAPPGAGGWFEVRLLSGLLKADQPLTVKWIDCYRQ